MPWINGLNSQLSPQKIFLLYAPGKILKAKKGRSLAGATASDGPSSEKSFSTLSRHVNSPWMLTAVEKS